MHLLQRRLVDSRRDAKSELQQPVQLWLQPLNQAAAARLHQQTDRAQHRNAERLRRAPCSQVVKQEGAAADLQGKANGFTLSGAQSRRQQD